MSKGQNHMNLINCHAARIHLPKEIFISIESLSLRELTVQILLDLELYRMGYLQSSKTRRLKVEIISDASGDSNFEKIT